MNLKFLSWHEGKYSDLWFFVHFFSGMTGGTIMLLAGMPQKAIWVIAFLTAIVWEMIEWKKKIIETMHNRILDIFVGVAGCTVGSIYLESFGFNVQTNAIVLTIEMFTLAILGAIGWRNYSLYSKS